MMFPSVLPEQRPQATTAGGLAAGAGQSAATMIMPSMSIIPQGLSAIPASAKQDQQGSSEEVQVGLAQPSAIPPQHNMMSLNNHQQQQQTAPAGVSAIPPATYSSETMPLQQQQQLPQQFHNMFLPTPTAPQSSSANFLPNPFVMSSAFQAVSSALPAQAFAMNQGSLNRTNAMDAKSSPSLAPQPAPHQQSDYFALAAANLMMAAAAAAANGNPGPAQMLMPSAAFGQLGLGGAFGLPGQTPTGLSALINATGGVMGNVTTNPVTVSNQRKSQKSSTKAKKRKQQKKRRKRDEEQDDEEDTYATSSSVSESDDDDNDEEDDLDAPRKSSKSKNKRNHHRRRSTDDAAEDTSSSSSNSNKQASPPTRYMAERPRRSQSGGSNPSSNTAAAAGGAGATELDAAGEEAMFAEYNGEQRLTIDFDDLGTVTVPPERLGKKGLIPDGLAGSFMMYSERWFFVIKFVEDSASKTSSAAAVDSTARKLPNVLMHRCIEWKVKNEAWEDFHCIVETQEDALRRNTRGVTLCNKVFTEAMEMRAKEFQRLLAEEKSKPEPDQFQISFFESRMAAFRPKRFSEGPLLFGLRHKIVQRRAYIMTEEGDVVPSS